MSLFFNHIYILTVLLTTSITSKNIIAQEPKKNKYIVLTYEEKYQKSLHGIQKYFWVIPIDSIKNFDNKAYPLFLSGFSVSQLNNCKNGQDVNPKILSVKKGDYNFDSLWIINKDSLSQCINKSKKLLQTIKKTWTVGNKVIVKIYATPIIAELYSCRFSESGQQRYGYNGDIFIVDNFFQVDREFWESALKPFITKDDFSKIEFKKLAYPQ